MPTPQHHSQLYTHDPRHEEELNPLLTIRIGTSWRVNAVDAISIQKANKKEPIRFGTHAKRRLLRKFDCKTVTAFTIHHYRYIVIASSREGTHIYSEKAEGVSGLFG